MTTVIPKMEDMLDHIKSLEAQIETLEEEMSELVVENHNLTKQLNKTETITTNKTEQEFNYVFEGKEGALSRNREKLKKEWVKDAK